MTVGEKIMTIEQKKRACEVMNAAMEEDQPRYSYSHIEEEGIVLTVDRPVGGPYTSKVSDEELIQDLKKWRELLGAEAHGFESQSDALAEKAETYRGKALGCKELLVELKAYEMPAIGGAQMERTESELVNKKMQEAGITTDRPVSVIPDCYGPRYGHPFIPGASVTVGEFTVIGLAYLSEDLAKIVAPPGERCQPWPKQCTMGEAGKNTYVLVEITRNYLTDREVVFAESFREALIAFDFGPYDAWEDFAVNMNECGLMSDDRLEELRQGPDNDVLKEEVADYAVEHWGTSGCYIMEIKPDGSVTTHPEMSNRIEVM